MGKESGAYYCLSIHGKEYRIPDMIDYGDPDLKVYAGDASRLLLVGLNDFYGSVYFVYYFNDNTLTRLGQVDIEQPDDVGEYGVRKISFKSVCKNRAVRIESYLDGACAGKNEFPLNDL